MTASTPLEVVVAVPQGHRLSAGQPDGALGVGVVEGAGEGDDPDLHCLALDPDDVVLDDRVGEQRLGDLPHLGEGGLVGLVDLELEPLALADVDDAVEAEPRQRPVHGLALGVEDLRLGHHIDDDAGHGHS